MKKNVLVIILAAIVLLFTSTIYIVQETERAVVLRFGKLTEDNVRPGLHIKLPFADRVRKFDARVLTLDALEESFFTAEKKRLIVDSYVKWRINDVATYYKATGGNEDIAQSRLSSRVNDGLRNQFGRRTLREVVSGKRDELITEITTSINNDVQKELGITVVDVRVKRIDLPPEVSEPVYRRMKAEREKEARELRSKGLEAAEKIRATADKERTILEATAYKEAEVLRGEGDAAAAAIYSSAYGKNQEFYAFMRSLNAYKQSFGANGDVLLLSPDSDFFRYLNDAKGAR
jgi:membrane protease subunit HflC